MDMNIELRSHEIMELLTEAMRIGSLSAYKVIKPASDEITLAEAIEMVGSRKWVYNKIKEGELQGFKRNQGKTSNVYYSRLDVENLRFSETIALKAERTLQQNERDFNNFLKKHNEDQITRNIRYSKNKQNENT
jgi:hypothetical protein